MFKPFDTIEVSFPQSDENQELIRGILLYSEKSIGIKGLHDNVFMNVKEFRELRRINYWWSFLGNNVKINTTRLVLTEKIDSGLIKSYNDLPVSIG